MNTQHTPGPWIYDDELAKVLTEDNEIIASLLPPPSEMPDGAVDTELLGAVGTLIAAAPELLDALHKVLMALESVHNLYQMNTRKRIEQADEWAENAWNLIHKLTDE